MHLLVWNSIYIQFSAVEFRHHENVSALREEKREKRNKVNPWIKWSKIKGNLNIPQNTTYSVVVWKKTYLPRKKTECIMLVNASSIKRKIYL